MVDTPKVLKPGRDYVQQSPSAEDERYFGKRFSPNKMEPYEVAQVERALDSLLQLAPFSGMYIIDFKYKMVSVKTTNKKLQVRVQAICNDMAERLNWKNVEIVVADGGKCFFSFIYDLTDHKVLQFQVNSSG